MEIVPLPGGRSTLAHSGQRSGFTSCVMMNALETFGLLFLFYAAASATHERLATSGTSSQPSAVHLWTDTVLEVNGVSNVADVFGIT